MIAGRNTDDRGRAFARARARIVELLGSRRAEIEEAIFARISDRWFDQPGANDAEYVAGLRATVAAAVDYGLTGIEQGEEWSGPIPSVAVAQAQRAARSGVGLETVLLRYAAGHRLLCDFVMTEADLFPGEALRHVLDMQGSLAERLMAGIATEYKREVQRAECSQEQRHAERVQRLLAGEPLDMAELDYDFDAWHLGVIATGAGAREALRGLMASSNRQILAAWRGEETVWAWLGGQRRLTAADIERSLPAKQDANVSLAVGEPGRGIEGWRLTHHQAQEALLVAMNRPRRLTRYAENMLLAAAMRDKTLTRSLQEIYLSPLANQKDGGAVSRETLRRYFDARNNAATAAVVLGVDRHTVERRLRAIEKRLGRLLHTCQPELEVALQLQELGSAAGADNPSPAR